MLPDMDKKLEKQVIIKMAGYLEKKGRMRTKSKIEQDQWFAALRDACRTNNLQTFVRHREHRKSSAAAAAAAESRRHNSRGRGGHNNNSNNEDGAAITAAAAAATSEDARTRQRYDRSLMESFDDVFFEVAKRNGFRNRAALRKAESDDRIAFYRELHGLVRTDAVTCQMAAAAAAAVTGDKEMSCSRSRSLSYESIYFKPQENYGGVPAAAQPPPAEPPPYKSHSCRELVTAGRPAAEATASLSHARRRSHDSESDDYAELIDIDAVPDVGETAADGQPEPAVPNDTGTDAAEEVAPSSLSAVAEEDSDEGDREANVDVVYVNSDRVPFADAFVPEDGPPLPEKKKKKQSSAPAERPQERLRSADGLCVFQQDDGEEVIYDVPIPHGKLIEHFRRLTVASPVSVKRHSDVVYDDSLEPLFNNAPLYMTPDSLEIAAIFPTYKRWSNDSGFNNYDETCSLFPPDYQHNKNNHHQQHHQTTATRFEDSLEPVMAMIHHDRKIWQNVPNINSIDYFR